MRTKFDPINMLEEARSSLQAQYGVVEISEKENYEIIQRLSKRLKIGSRDYQLKARKSKEALSKVLLNY